MKHITLYKMNVIWLYVLYVCVGVGVCVYIYIYKAHVEGRGVA